MPVPSFDLTDEPASVVLERIRAARAKAEAAAAVGRGSRRWRPLRRAQAGGKAIEKEIRDMTDEGVALQAER